MASQYTMDLFCNTVLVTEMSKCSRIIRLKINSGTMVVTQKEKIVGYQKNIWFIRIAIRVVPAPDGTIYLVDINETHYWGSF